MKNNNPIYPIDEPKRFLYLKDSIILTKTIFDDWILTLFYLLFVRKFIILNSKKKLIGYLAFIKIFNKFKIITICVSKEEREKGFGRALISSLEGYAKNKGIKKIILNVDIKNNQAIHFYKSLDYIIARKIRKYGKVLYTMEKPLF